MALKNFAVMSFDGIYLLMPQSVVATIELVNCVDPEAVTTGALGALKSGGGEWPVFALTKDFKICPELPASYRFCVAFNDDDEPAFALACEEVSTLSMDNVDQIKPVQTCMRTLNCPLESLLLNDGKLMLVSDIGTMRQFLLPEALAPEVALA